MISVIIISGLSGSGKSIALQALEDIGHYCVDNLPASLLPDFIKKLSSQKLTENRHAAVSIDSRNREFLQSLPATLDEMQKLGIDFKIVFLKADDAILLKRFNETRRKHPLTDEGVALREGIYKEKQLLAPLLDKAAKSINTTHTTPHELRSLIKDFAVGEIDTQPSLLFESFGYKFGTPQDADFVFDVRCLPNPYWQEDLRAFSGLDQPVIDYLQKQPLVDRMVEQISAFLENWLPSFRSESRSYITVAIGCTGGQHRSVYVCTRLMTYFSSLNMNVHIRHRQLAETP